MKAANVETAEKIPPRERILAVAADLFYRHGIRAVGVEAIADAAGTNKVTLYRHFASKDQLVAEYLRCMGVQANSCWAKLEAEFPGDARAQLGAWVRTMAAHMSGDERGCALANAAVELPEKATRRARSSRTSSGRSAEARSALPGREPVGRRAARRRIVAAARRRPRHRAEHGLGRPGARLVHMADVMIASHEPERTRA